MLTVFVNTIYSICHSTKKLIILCISSVFRGQNFSSLPLPDLVHYGSLFGQNHAHTVMGNPPSHPEIAVVFQGAEDSSACFQWHTNSTFWHSDVSYEYQPPGTTFPYHFQSPPLWRRYAFREPRCRLSTAISCLSTISQTAENRASQYVCIA